MNGGDLNVELPVLHATSQYVTDLSQRMQGQLKHLDDLVAALPWKGPAASSFQRLHEEWQADYRQLNQALTQIGVDLMQNHNDYVRHEEAIKQGLRPGQSSL